MKRTEAIAKPFIKWAAITICDRIMTYNKL